MPPFNLTPAQLEEDRIDCELINRLRHKLHVENKQLSGNERTTLHVAQMRWIERRAK